MSQTQATLSVCVARIHTEATDIVSLELVSADGAALPGFSAGSHIDLHLPGGLVRQYSLCNDPAETHRYLIAVLRDPASRGGSRAVHDKLSEGDMLTISAPRNHFALAHGAKKSLLMAGGIGVTPILCMAERLAVMSADFHMHYATRSPDRTAFADRIARSAFAEKVQLHYDDGDDVQKLDLKRVLAKPQPETHLYVCGPRGYMDAVLATAREQGWAEKQLHWEFFAGVDAAPRSGDDAFEVQLASSGRVITVPADKTIVQALAAEGVDIMVSCEEGVCGTCMTRVLDGTPEHRDAFLTPEEQAENDQFLPCCSRSKSARLVVNL